jgi:hypothetical protein
VITFDADDYESSLAHYGVLRRSGRYPYGSGGPEHSGEDEFITYANELKSKGLSDVEISDAMGITTTQLRAGRSIVKNQQRQQNINMAQRLKDKGYGNSAIGQRMGINESSVRALLAPGTAAKADVLQATASALKARVDEKKYIDVGAGVENHIGVSSSRLKTAVSMLEEEGYKVHYLKVTQLGTGNETRLKILARPEVTGKELWANRDQISQFNDFSEDGGKSYTRIQKPLSVDLSRVAVRYGPDGGANADGVIYVRPGVDDVSIGGSRYAQVRIAVDGSHYLKGMAVYKEGLPEGTDLQFNTNKKDTGNKLDAMKPMKKDAETGEIDAENPFGSAIKRQIGEKDENGNTKPTSVMNIVNEEGDWANWSKSLSTQFLSKQNPKLAQTQLDMTYESRANNLESIRKLTNPAVKRKLLEDFADEADSAAVHLKAAALPRQGSHVIMPVASMKDTEIYAPNFKPGERVVLVRYPHGGKFEIPELTVNNNQREANALLGKGSKGKLGEHALDAVGISPNTASRLSGADFDGDTVLVIPNNSGRVKSESPLEKLKNFNPQEAYPAYEGMPKMSKQQKQTQMGLVSNLITDMTIKGATHDELASAVRHSMVVIDAEKHNLDYKASARDNGISALMKKYQDRSQGGSSTLISRATSPATINKRKARSAADGGAIDPVTGRRMYVPTDEHYVIPAHTKATKRGVVDVPDQTIYKTEKIAKLALTDDAHTLSSGTPIERIYADHSNRLKDLANEARKEYVSTKPIPYSPSAKLAYAPQVKSLNDALSLAQSNAPRERQAQIIANAILDRKKQANPDMDKDELKKERSKALIEARIRTGASKTQIKISQEEWNAIQAGAISNHQLEQILRNADPETVKKLATPKTAVLMTDVKIARAKQMIESGYTQADVADALGVSLSTLKSADNLNLKGVESDG